MKKAWSKIDKPLLIVFLIYIILGLVMIYSSSSISSVLRYDKPSYYFFKRQLLFILVGLFGGVFLLTKTHTKYYKFFAFLALVACVFLLIFLLIKQTITNNASSWYYVKGFGFQPSEFVKSVSIVCMGVIFGKIFNKKNPTVVKAIIPTIGFFIIALLIAKQPDLGSAFIYFGIIGAVFLSLPFKEPYMKTVKNIIYVLIVIVLFVLIFKSSVFTKLAGEDSRFNYSVPCSRYTSKTGYQVCNGFIAINNGGLLGVGLGNSTQKYLYLPESHTDFIFPIICEELGLLVGIGVILGYIFMLFRIYQISKKATNLRNQIIAYGVFIYLSLHILINLVGITALLPLTGVPLPLLSYGGSFTINVIVMIFIVERICYESNDEKSKIN